MNASIFPDRYPGIPNMRIIISLLVSIIIHELSKCSLSHPIHRTTTQHALLSKLSNVEYSLTQAGRKVRNAAMVVPIHFSCNCCFCHRLSWTFLLKKMKQFQDCHLNILIFICFKSIMQKCIFTFSAKQHS